MVIIAVSYENRFTCSCDGDANTNENDPLSVLRCICKKQKLIKDEIEELIVVMNDDVVSHFTYEDF